MVYTIQHSEKLKTNSKLPLLRMLVTGFPGCVAINLHSQTLCTDWQNQFVDWIKSIENDHDKCERYNW